MKPPCPIGGRRRHIDAPPPSARVKTGQGTAIISHATSTLRSSIEHCIPSLTFPLQTLIQRHEAYILATDKERDRMMAQINLLQLQKNNLESDNSRYIDENRKLLNTLEDLNEHSVLVEAHNNTLSATLDSTQVELARLSALAARTKDLETQLLIFEQEQLDLRTKVAYSEEQETRARQRWLTAERSLGEMQDQIEQIESDARRDRQVNAQAEGTSHRAWADPKTLLDPGASKELRLHGGIPSPQLSHYVATETSSYSRKGAVINSFVKDTLQDNTELEAGIIEARELIQHTTERPNSLRHQHELQPEQSSHWLMRQGVETDLDLSSRRVSTIRYGPEVHVHHHYHDAVLSRPHGKKVRSGRRQQRAVSPLRQGLENDDKDASKAEEKEDYSDMHSKNVSQVKEVSTSTMRPRREHWSSQSNQSRVASITPSSPHSTVFDRCSTVNDSTRPTSPESSFTTSPPLKPYRTGHRSYSNSSSKTANHFTPYDPILEEGDNMPGLTGASVELHVPPLRRSASHESILSLSPFEEKSERRQKSQLYKKPSTLFPLQSTAVACLSATLASSSTFSAAPSKPNPHSSSQRIELNRHLTYLQTISKPKVPVSPSAKGLLSVNPIRKAGSWIPWSKSQPASVATLQSIRQANNPTPRATAELSSTGLVGGASSRYIKIQSPIETDSHMNSTNNSVITAESLDAMAIAMGGRTPGVNQRGPIPGFLRPMASTTSSFRDRMMANGDREVPVDVEGLRDALT